MRTEASDWLMRECEAENVVKIHFISKNVQDLWENLSVNFSFFFSSFDILGVLARFRRSAIFWIFPSQPGIKGLTVI